MSHLSIYLTNLGKYNEGELIGEWVELPVSDDEMHAVFKRIGISSEPDASGNYYEEYFITDYETDIPGFSVGEYDDPWRLNNIARLIDAMGEGDFQIFKNAVEAGYVGTSLEDIENFDSGNYIFYEDVDNSQDLGYADIKATYDDIENVPADVLANYFDYEAYGRDAAIEFNIWNYIGSDDDSIEEACTTYGVDDVEDIDAYIFNGVDDDQELGEKLAEDLGDLSLLGTDTLTTYFDYEAYANSTMIHPGVGTFTSEGYIEDLHR